MLWLIPVNTDKTPLRSLSGESLETSTRVLVGLGFSVSGCVVTIMLLSSQV